jgi:hypothetical protein
MKHSLIIFAAVSLLLSAIAASSQSLSISITPQSSDTDLVEVKFPAPGHQQQIFLWEMSFNASSQEECFASRDFSNARPADPARSGLAFDIASNSYTLRWLVDRPKREDCRAIAAGSTIAASDLAVWQANYGAAGLFADPFFESDAYGIGNSDRRGNPNTRNRIAYSVTSFGQN